MQENREFDLDLEIISDEELSMFQNFELEDDSIKEMETINKESFYKKVNRHAIEKVEESLDEDEEIEFYFTGVYIQTVNAKVVTSLLSHSASYVSSDWGVNRTVIFTNKKMFIVQRNDMLQYLKHEEVYYEDIKEIYMYKKNNIVEIRYKNNNKKQIEFPKESFELIYKLISEKIIVKKRKGEYLSLMDKFLKVYLIFSLIVAMVVIIVITKKMILKM